MTSDADTPAPLHLPAATFSAEALPDRPTAFFNALLTEQFVLQSVRSTSVSEAAMRATTYLTLLSAALVAFGFTSQTSYAQPMIIGAGTLVFVLGLFTHVRLVQISLEDVAALAAMQRIRRYYATLLPGAQEFFPRPADGEAPDEMLRSGRRSSWRGVLGTLPFAIWTINSLAATAAVTAAMLEETPLPVAVGAGIVMGLTALAAGVIYQERQYAHARHHTSTAAHHHPRTGDPSKEQS